MTDTKPTPAPANENVPTVHYVSVIDRLTATVIDLVLSILVLAPFFPAAKFPVEIQEAMIKAEQKQISQQELYITVMDYLKYGGGYEQIATNKLLEFTISGLVVILFWVYRAATPGKMLFRMKIVDARTFEKPTTGKLIVRYLGYFVAAIPFGLGFFWIFLNKKRRGWHDYLAGTAVIYTKAPNKKLNVLLGFAFIIIAIIVISISK